LNINPEMIDLCRGDTDLHKERLEPPRASRQTYISGNAVLAAADSLEALLIEEARHMLGKRHADLHLDNTA
jgi:CO/xanthine dehydrogenase Mo-binding subunit